MTENGPESGGDPGTELRSWRVWLDDARPMPPDWTHHVRTASEAIALLCTGQVEAISLDHDLGEETVSGSGYTVACWIEEAAVLGNLAPITVAIHSANPVGVARMRAAIRAAGRAWNRCGESGPDRTTS